MKCDKFECCYISDCTIGRHHKLIGLTELTYFGTHTYSHVDFYMYLYFIIYEMMLKLIFKPTITSSL